MHEISLCEGILQILEEQSQKQQFSRIKTVWLEIGELSSVEIDAMRFAFDAVMRNTIADSARLEILSVKGSARCRNCGKTQSIISHYDACSACGNYALEITDGQQMRIKELEVEHAMYDTN